MKVINSVALVITILFSGNPSAADKCLPSYFQEGKEYAQPYSGQLTLLEIDHQSCWVKIFNGERQVWVVAERLSGFSLVSGLEKKSAAIHIAPAAVSDELVRLFNIATETIAGITDRDSAIAAIPAMGELGSKTEAVESAFLKLSDVAQRPISSIANERMKKLQPLVDKMLQLPSVGSILTPVMGPIMERLEMFGG